MTGNPIHWSDVLTLITVVGAGVGVWWALYRQIEQERKDRIAAVQLLTAMISDYKLQVAREYATTAAIQQVEERVVQAIERLGDRLDKFLDDRSRNRS